MYQKIRLSMLLEELNLLVVVCYSLNFSSPFATFTSFVYLNRANSNNLLMLDRLYVTAGATNWDNAFGVNGMVFTKQPFHQQLVK